MSDLDPAQSIIPPPPVIHTVEMVSCAECGKKFGRSTVLPMRNWSVIKPPDFPALTACRACMSIIDPKAVHTRGLCYLLLLRWGASAG